MRTSVNPSVSTSSARTRNSCPRFPRPASRAASTLAIPAMMRETVALARQHGVAVGAHPGFPDLIGFGRREIRATPREVEDFVIYQIGALAAVAAAQGVRLQHVKAARRALQHGRSGRGIGGCHRARNRCRRLDADSLWSAGLGVDRRRPPRGFAYRARRIRRPFLPA